MTADNSPFEFTKLIDRWDINPDDVLVMRHRPSELELRRILPWLAVEDHETFNAYQSIQSPRAEKAMLGAKYVASFIGDRAGRATFVGLYGIGDNLPLDFDAFMQIPAHLKLCKLGMPTFDRKERPSILKFDLERLEDSVAWSGRLVVKWPPPERAWYRWANNNVFEIVALHEDNIFSQEVPPWTEIILSHQELQVLPETWRSALSHWRGIYLIFDEASQKAYVGSASGIENILGRWTTYATTGHGGNKDLRERDPVGFRFSILQRVSPDMDACDVISLENSWKQRLHTREFGMNRN